MNEKFKNFIESLESSYQRLMKMEPVTVPTLPTEIPLAGIYFFSEGDRHHHVGRSNRIRQRLQEQCSPIANHNTAPFAFRLAREATGKIARRYVGQESRNNLLTQPEFKKEFIKAK